MVRFPSTREKIVKDDHKVLLAEQAPLRVNASLYAFGSLLMVLVGLFFGDFVHVAWFSLTSIASILFARFLDRISIKRSRSTFEFLMLTAALGGQFVLPQGPASAMLFYVFVTTVLVLSETLKRAIGVSAFGLGLFLALPLAGISFPVVTGVPASYSFIILLLCPTIALMVQFSRAQQTVSQAMESLAKTENSIELEMAEITRRNLLLHEGNLSVERGAVFLRDTLAAEAKSTSQLSMKRDEQKRLTNAIHHDMREPLRGIVSFSQLIQRKLLKREEAEGVQEYLGYAIDGGQRMAKMLDDLLMYSKNNHSETPHKVDLSGLVSEVEGDLHNLIERSNATIVVEDLPCIIGFETQLKQLFQNLLSNALKFRKEDESPRIVIRSKQLEELKYTIIEVEDNGVGIPANQLDKVFGLFNRAHEGGNYEGSGVGLALCRRIAISHGATLTVKSEVGVGTTFFFSLPSVTKLNYTNHIQSAIQEKEVIGNE